MDFMSVYEECKGNWVKPDFCRTFDIALKNLRVSAPPREISARREESALW